MDLVEPNSIWRHKETNKLHKVLRSSTHPNGEVVTMSDSSSWLGIIRDFLLSFHHVSSPTE